MTLILEESLALPVHHPITEAAKIWGFPRDVPPDQRARIVALVEALTNGAAPLDYDFRMPSPKLATLLPLDNDFMPPTTRAALLPLVRWRRTRGPVTYSECGEYVVRLVGAAYRATFRRRPDASGDNPDGVTIPAGGLVGGRVPTSPLSPWQRGAQGAAEAHRQVLEEVRCALASRELWRPEICGPTGLRQWVHVSGLVAIRPRLMVAPAFTENLTARYDVVPIRLPAGHEAQTEAGAPLFAFRAAEAIATGGAA